MILTLDIATRTGWAAGRPGSSPEWGARDFSDKAGNGAVVGRFRHSVNALCFKLKPRVIAFESPYVRQPTDPLVLRRLYGMVSQVEAVAWELKIRCFEARPQEIAKFFVGNGGLKREQKKLAMIAKCLEHGWDVEGDEDAAEALALWAMAEAQFDPYAAARRLRAIAEAARAAGKIGPLFPDPESNCAPRAATREALDHTILEKSNARPPMYSKIA